MKKKNFKFVRGDDYSVKLTFTDVAGNPLILTENQLNLHARNNNDDLVLTLSTNDKTINIIDENSAVLKFTHDLTQDLNIETLKYDLQLTNVQNERKTVLYGEITLIEDQTRI